GTFKYNAYSPDHEFDMPNKVHTILGTSDPAFRGDPQRYNPEEMLVASLSACHMLWYLHLCSVNGVIVIEYEDAATGSMGENADGGGQFSEVTLYPKVRVTEASMIEKANKLHAEANKKCFIANSCNFPVHHEGEAWV
ncbi:MAG: OsmC family protein, partial [Saprospiraceae bacterium]